MKQGTAVTSADVCIARHCDLYSRCAVSIKPADAMLVFWFSPTETGEFCSRYMRIKNDESATVRGQCVYKNGEYRHDPSL